MKGKGRNMPEIEKTQTPVKMSFDEFFEVIVKKSDSMARDIHKKMDEYDEFLLDELQKYAVDESLPIPKWLLGKIQKENSKGTPAPPGSEKQTSETGQTVDVTLKIPIPKDYLVYLQKLASVLGISVDDILKDAIYETLQSFFSGDYLKDWLDWRVKNIAENKDAKTLEASVEHLRSYNVKNLDREA
jgi:hypothetical protein